MKKLVCFILLTTALFSCDQNRVSPEQIAAEKSSIESTLQVLFYGYSEKDIQTVTSLFSKSNDLIIFGSDAMEVFTTIDDFEKQLERDFQLFESCKFGELQNLSVQLSQSGELAVAVFEAPVEMIFDGDTTHIHFRSARTFKKENDTWLIVQSISSTASKGQSSAELLESID